MSDIRPIETRYKGYRFRSRLEARWAVFFDVLGIEWEYEPQGYDVNGRPYLPDFYLSQLRVYAEVKPTPGSACEHDKLFRSFSETVGSIIVLAGVPFENFGRIYSRDVTCSSAGHADFDALIDVVAGEPMILFVSLAHSDCRWLADADWTHLPAVAYQTHPLIRPSNAWWKACAAARSARFEHGERG